MNVKINESGAYQLPPEVKHLGPLRGEVRAPAGDHAVLQEKILACLPEVFAVENCGILQQNHLTHTSKAKVQQGHPDRHAAPDLVEDDAPGTVRHG